MKTVINCVVHLMKRCYITILQRARVTSAALRLLLQRCLTHSHSFEFRCFRITSKIIDPTHGRHLVGHLDNHLDLIINNVQPKYEANRIITIASIAHTLNICRHCKTNAQGYIITICEVFTVHFHHLHIHTYNCESCLLDLFHYGVYARRKYLPNVWRRKFSLTTNSWDWSRYAWLKEIKLLSRCGNQYIPARITSSIWSMGYWVMKVM